MFNIPEKLKKYRNALGLSQTEVAEKIEVTKPTYASYEKGKDISIGTLKKLADLFEVSFESFFSEEEIEKDNNMVKIPILSAVGAGDLREAVLSTRGPEWTNLWCTGCHASGTAG